MRAARTGAVAFRQTAKLMIASVKSVGISTYGERSWRPATSMQNSLSWRKITTATVGSKPWWEWVGGGGGELYEGLVPPTPPSLRLTKRQNNLSLSIYIYLTTNNKKWKPTLQKCHWWIDGNDPAKQSAWSEPVKQKEGWFCRQTASHKGGKTGSTDKAANGELQWRPAMLHMERRRTNRSCKWYNRCFIGCLFTASWY